MKKGKGKGEKPNKKKTLKIKGRVAGQAQARQRIEAMLMQAQLELRTKDIESRRYIHVNKDGSIDAELSVLGKRGVQSDDLFYAIEEAIPSQAPGLWVSTGARFSASKDEDNYSRYKGLQQVQAFYQRYTRPKRAINVLTGRTVARRVEKRQKRKIESAFVRIHWNQLNEKPGRPKIPK